MTRHREHLLLWAAVGVVFGAVAAATFFFLPSSHQRPAGEIALASTGVFEPTEAMFGDQVVARLDVVGRSGLRLAPEVNFFPYEIASTTRSTVPLGGHRTLYRFRYALSCLRTTCQIKQGVRFFRFGNSVVRGAGQLTETTWPTLPVITRAGLTPMTMTKTLRTGEAAAVELRRPDTTGAWVAWVGVLVLLAALVLVWLPKPRLGRRTNTAPAPETVDHLVVALRLAHTIAELVSVDRLRSSLEDVADELEKSGAHDAAGRVRTLAWSETDPTPDDVRQLVAELDGGAR